MTYKEYIWGLDGTTIIDKLLKEEELKSEVGK